MDAATAEAEPFIDEPAPPAPPPRPRASAPPPRPAAAAEPRDRSTRVQREMRDDEEQDLLTYIHGLVGDAPVQIAIVRKRPSIGPNGENILGTLETVEDKIDEEYIFDTWGGGTYELKIKKQNQRGSFEFFKSRTIKIAGEPRMNGRALVPGNGAAAAAGGDDGLIGKTLDMYERASERERARAERLERDGQRGGIDFAAIERMQAPLVAELAEARRMIADLQKDVLAQIAKPPPKDEFRDRLLERSVEGGDKRIEDLRSQYENRLAAQRELYEGRIDKINERHEDEVKRLEDRHRDDIRRMEDQHEREIARTEKAAEHTGKGTEQGFQARIDSLKEANSRLERELTALQSKLGALEARKDQTIGEKADELIKVKEALDGIGGGDSDNDGPWYTKVIDAVGNSQAALDFIAKIGGNAGAAPPAGGEAGMPPVGQPFYGPDGGVYVRNPDNTFTPLPAANALPGKAGAAGKRKRRAAAQAVAEAMQGDDAGEAGETGEEIEAAPDGTPPVKQPSAKEIKQAVLFMENAVKSNTDPAMFASSARNLVPSELLQWIQQVGPENFLSKLRLDSGSPLTTQNGRNFVRRVFKHLFEGGEE